MAELRKVLLRRPEDGSEWPFLVPEALWAKALRGAPREQWDAAVELGARMRSARRMIPPYRPPQSPPAPSPAQEAPEQGGGGLGSAQKPTQEIGEGDCG